MSPWAGQAALALLGLPPQGPGGWSSKPSSSACILCGGEGAPPTSATAAPAGACAGAAVFATLSQLKRVTLATIFPSNMGTCASSLVTSIHKAVEESPSLILNRKWYFPGSGNFARMSCNRMPAPGFRTGKAFGMSASSLSSGTW
eukprot:CAMPEP_0179101776 /NCGR_PEP_ID=MMETSP0796-20121207/47074_1 /TAXON_ID=73915 /ORGANISM="Pyrodinium bahamense, Strain pbaha01" /LENGTH=144 /DNA_ID=CAMNT_0020799637 /DNA_START=220 /DNA_END=657 /DNA_ORIENTATION=+